MATKPSPQVHEPPLRLAITDINNAIYNINTMPVTTRDHLIARAQFHLERAQDHIREWAVLNGIEIRERMQT